VPRRSYDLGLIIPSREEFDSARRVLEFSDPLREGDYFLHPFTVPGSTVNGVALVLFDVGPTNAAVATTNLLALFDIRQFVLIGTAGALDPELKLGDVVIAAGIDEYLHAGKTEAGQFQVGGRVWTARHDLVSFANNFRYLAGGYQSWHDSIQTRDESESGPDYWVSQIASGDILGSAREFRQWLLHYNRRRVALEMEGAGAAQAIYQSGRTDLLVIRGISNLADGQAPIPAWSRLAELNAVELLAALVTHPEFPWPTPRVAPAPSPTPPDKSTDHVFLSYDHDDAAAVDRIQAALETADLQVWRDTDRLLPGQDLRSTIRTAISGNTFVFIACFSTASLARVKSRQNEELTMAIEEARQRRIDRPWLIPVRLDDCEVPDRELGGGRTLHSLVWIDLFGPKAADQINRLVKSVLMILGQN
jgi:nucleoside phosphorylase